MERIELDLQKIQILGGKREEENMDFRTYLKMQDPNKVDKIVHRLNEQITKKIDCTNCGNCCHHLRPLVTVEEIKRLAQIDGTSVEAFTKQHIEKTPYEDEPYLKTTPCKYLKDKKCSIYTDRPEDCKSYPHTHKSGFTSRLFGMLYNYSICPIVFNLVENLKQELHYQY